MILIFNPAPLRVRALEITALGERDKKKMILTTILVPLQDALVMTGVAIVVVIGTETENEKGIVGIETTLVTEVEEGNTDLGETVETVIVMSGAADPGLLIIMAEATTAVTEIVVIDATEIATGMTLVTGTGATETETETGIEMNVTDVVGEAAEEIIPMMTTIIIEVVAKVGDVTVIEMIAVIEVGAIVTGTAMIAEIEETEEIGEEIEITTEIGIETGTETEVKTAAETEAMMAMDLMIEEVILNLTLLNVLRNIFYFGSEKWTSAANGDRSMPVGASSKHAQRTDKGREQGNKQLNPNRPMSPADMDLSDMER